MTPQQLYLEQSRQIARKQRDAALRMRTACPCIRARAAQMSKDTERRRQGMLTHKSAEGSQA